MRSPGVVIDPRCRSRPSGMRNERDASITFSILYGNAPVVGLLVFHCLALSCDRPLAQSNAHATRG